MSLYYSEEVREFVNTLGGVKCFNEALQLWVSIETKIPNLDIIICLNGCQKQTPQALVNFQRDCDGKLLSYFEDENFCYINKAIISKSTPSGGVDLPIDYSITFDTNFANYINAVVRGKKLGENQNLIIKIINSLLINKLNYDYSFYFIENTKQVLRYNNSNQLSSFEFWQKLDKSFRQNVVSLMLFRSIDTDHYKKTLVPKAKITYVQAVKKAVKQTHDSYNSKSGKELSKHYVSSQRRILLILIKIISIQLSSKVSATRKTELLVCFMHNELGAYFDRETVIALEYYKDRNNVPILAKFSTGRMPKDLLRSLDNIAWDMLAMRTMEEIMQLEHNCKFYIPYFLTFDGNLKKLHELFQVKGVVFNKEKSFFTTVSNNSLPAYCDTTSKLREVVLDKYFSINAVNERKNKPKTIDTKVCRMIRKEYRELRAVINKS